MEKGVSKAFRDSNDSSLALSKKQLAFSKANYDESRDAYARFRLIVITAIGLALVVALWWRCGARGPCCVRLWGR